jgi:uncharacterized protein YbjT (DUF2867 family)
MRVAVIGATGLIGRHIVNCLTERPEIHSVKIIARRNPGIHHPKVSVDVIDFANLEAFRMALLGAEAVFCAVGTTQKKVGGDLEAYRRIDFDIPVNAARLSAKMDCHHFSLVSSVGADHKSRVFYSRLKGETEQAVTASGVKQVAMFRPSLLLGDRKEVRFGERVGELFMRPLSFLMPDIYKPIKGHDVARAMVELAINSIGNENFRKNDITSNNDIMSNNDIASNEDAKNESKKIEPNDISSKNQNYSQITAKASPNTTEISSSSYSTPLYHDSLTILHYREIKRLAERYGVSVDAGITGFR